MRKLALIVEYDGTGYHGFQRQRRGQATIQQALEEALERLTGERSVVSGAGRTDSGVHALGQVVAFKTASTYPEETFLKALNFYLPGDIAVKGIVPVPEAFDPRRRASSRLYQYRMLRSATPSPVWAHRTLLVPEALDIQAMARAASMLVGDWQVPLFSEGHSSTGRGWPQIIRNSRLAEEGPFTHFTVEANYFLPRQVRRMAGALLQVGLGRRTPGDWSYGPALPAHGLYLMEVRYSGAPLGEEKGEMAVPTAALMGSPRPLPKEALFY